MPWFFISQGFLCKYLDVSAICGHFGNLFILVKVMIIILVIYVLGLQIVIKLLRAKKTRGCGCPLIINNLLSDECSLFTFFTFFFF